uniref:Uncharacterized protein n=1 Tax=Cereibacter sphaeroides (strain ATCC 17025 / ATH 2.4.3) TaxID=349102 RepID=A4WS13_CERS5
MNKLATTTTIRLFLTQALTARAAALETKSLVESDQHWSQFDEAVNRLLDALSVSEEAGMLGLLERFELLGVSAAAFPAVAPAQAEPVGGAL